LIVDAWVDIRLRARACHEQALATAKGDRRATSIIAAALKNDSLEVRHFDFNPGILGSLDRSSRLVNVAKNQNPLDELVVIAHEIGHFHLHHDPHNEVTVRPQGLGGDPVDSGAGRVEGYSRRSKPTYSSENSFAHLIGFARNTLPAEGAPMRLPAISGYRRIWS
jgi:DNA helicase-2/ATP-dependent DNA helicase PcrA